MNFQRFKYINYKVYIVSLNKIKKFVFICDKKVDLVEKNDNQHQKKMVWINRNSCV